MMSCMLKAAVPRPTATRKRSERPAPAKRRQVSRNAGRGRLRAVADGLRASCFHSASRLSTIVASAAPCTTWISRTALKWRSTRPNNRPLPIMPISNITYISATTRGRASAGARSVASARPAVCVVCKPGADQQEGERRTGVADPGRAVGVARHHDQCERHDREAAELQQRADPEVGHALPAEHRAVRVGAKADQRAERREHQRQADHQRDQPGRHAHLDDHHAVERADEQHHRHAHGHLEQRQAEQPTKRQFVRRRIGERQKARADLGPLAGQRRIQFENSARGVHFFTSSMACDL